MFKRFTARLLILLQVYNCVFQGVAHANVIQAHHAVRDEIYLHTAPSKDGGLRIALGTNRGGDEGGEELLDVIEVPSYQILSKTAQDQVFQRRSAFKKAFSSSAAALPITTEVQQDQALPVLGLGFEDLDAGVGSGPKLEREPDSDLDSSADLEMQPASLFSKSGVTRSPEGAHFTLQGLEIFVNNNGQALIQGIQNDFSKPIFLSWGGTVILNDVHAKAMQISAPKIFGRGKSIIEELVLEGSAQDGTSVFINGGSLTAKELFLKNLTSENNGSIMAPRFLVDGQLKSKGSLESDELIVEEDGVLKLDATSTAAIKSLFLSRGGHLENHIAAPTTIDVLDTSGGILTNHGTLGIGEIATDSAFQAVHNRHLLSVERGDIKTAKLENAGTLIAESSDFQVVSGSSVQALKVKTLVVGDEFTNETTGSLAAEAISGTGHFHNLGKVETYEQLDIGVKQLSNHGSVKAQSIVVREGLNKLLNTTDGTVVVDDLLYLANHNFGKDRVIINDGSLKAKSLSFSSHELTQRGAIDVEVLYIYGDQVFKNQGEITVNFLVAYPEFLNESSLVTRRSATFVQGSVKTGLTNTAKAKAHLKRLNVVGNTEIINHGKMVVLGIDTHQGVLQITNSGVLTIDGARTLPKVAEHNFDNIALVNTLPQADPVVVKLQPQPLIRVTAEELQLVHDKIAKISRHNLITSSLCSSYSYSPSPADLQRFLQLYVLTLDSLSAIRNLPASGQESLLDTLIGQIYGNQSPTDYLTDYTPLFKAAMHKDIFPKIEAAREIAKRQAARDVKEWEEREHEKAQYLEQLIYRHLAPAISKIRLRVLNQPTGRLTLKSGKFEFAADSQFVNDGTLFQENAYFLWHPQSLQAIGSGTWHAKGSLELLDYNGSDLSKLIVDDALHVDVSPNGSRILRGKIEVPSFSASSGIDLFGSLTTHRSTYLAQGLTIAADAVAELKGLRIGIAGATTPADSPFTQRLAKMSQLSVEIDEQQKRITVLQALDIYPALTQKDYETEHFKRDVLPKLYAKFSHVPYYESYEKYIQSYARGYPLDIAIRDACAQSGHVFETDMQSIKVGQGIPFTMHSETERSALVSELRERQSKLEELQRQKTTLFSDVSVGDEIINYGTLRVIGVDTSSGTIKLINGGIAMIDDQQILPKLDERSPENLARVTTGARPVTWDSDSVEHGFNYTLAECRSNGSKYAKLYKALNTRNPYICDGTADPEFASASVATARSLASRYRVDFIKLYESEVVKSLSEGSAAEQAELQQYLKQFEPAYKEVLEKKLAYAKSLHPAVGSALVVESAKIPMVRLQVFNQATGKLTLKSGKFEFVGDAALVNDGTLTQHIAYTLWLTSAPGEFNRGTWQTKGSLGLLGYTGQPVGKLEIDGILHVDTSMDALEALEGLAKAQATRISITAPQLANAPTPARQEKVYPWPLEMVIAGDVTNAFDISAPLLKIRSQALKTTGNLFSLADLLDIRCTGDVLVDTTAMTFGRLGVYIDANDLTTEGRKRTDQAEIPLFYLHILPTWYNAGPQTALNAFYTQKFRQLYASTESGVYSEGPITLNLKKRLNNSFGVIKGTSYTITAPEVVNIGGLICGEAKDKCQIVAKSIHNKRAEQKAVGVNTCYGHPTRNGSIGNYAWCNGGCRSDTHTYETSGPGVFWSQGDLDLTYETLEMVASSAVSGGKLTLTAKAGDAVVAQRVIESDRVSGSKMPAMASTSIAVRNGIESILLAKSDLTGDLGSADIGATIYGENIHLKAAKIAFQSLGIAPRQQAQIIDMLAQSQGSMAYKMIGNGSVDTALPLMHCAIPGSVVILGKDAARHLSHDAIIDMQMTGRALHDIMGNQIYALYRGVAGLGLSITDFFKSTTDLVRAHKDTVSQRRLIKAGDDEREVEALVNPTLTTADLMASGVPALCLEFSHALTALEAEQQAMDVMRRARPKALPKPMLAIPASDVERGISAKGKVVIESETTLKVATSIKAEIIQLLAADKATIESTVIHYQVGENSWQVLDRTNLVALKTLIIQSPTIHFKAVNSHSGEESFFIADVIIDEAVSTTSVKLTREHSRRETVTTTIVDTHQNTSTHSSGGVAHMQTRVLYQEGVKNVNVLIEGTQPDVKPYVEQRDVHDTRQVTVDVQRHRSRGFLGGMFGSGGVRKSYHFSSASSTSRGSENAGRFFAMIGERYKATNPSFTAERSDITAPKVEISAGVNHHQSVEQTSSSGPIWNKSSVTAEKHKVHVNPNFGGAVHIHSPDVVVERVRGSGLFPNLHSDSQVKYQDVDDSHEHHHQSQKSLTSGAALIVKLAMTLATTTLMGNPLAAEGLMGTIASAGINTLCSDAAVCLIQNDGDPGRAMQALGERNIGKSMLMSMASAGLIGSGPITDGLSTGELITAYAKHELLKATVNATLAATIDGQDFKEAMLQGIVTAGISTVAAFGAHKIGDLQKPDASADAARGSFGGGTSSAAAAITEPISSATHKLLHTALGTGLGALTAAATEQDIARGAASGGFGALVGTLMTDAMVDDKDTSVTAQRMTQMSDLITATLALGVGLDPVSAYLAAHNASEHNALKHHRQYLESIGVVEEDEEVYEGEELEKTEAQQQYERGRQRHIKGALETARKIRGRALSIGSYEHVAENAGAKYDYYHGSTQAAGYVLEYGLTAASYIPGTTGVVMGVVEAAHGYGTGRYDAMDAAQTVVTSSLGVLKSVKPFVSVAKGGAKLDKAIGHSSSAVTAPSKMPVCMTQSQNPKAAMFKRVAQDDWGVGVKPYDVSTYTDLGKRSKGGDRLDIHHAPQKHAAEQIIPGYKEHHGPSIALPEREHRRIPNIKGDYTGTARSLLARDVQNLRMYTGASNKSIQELIALAKAQAPSAYQKK